MFFRRERPKTPTFQEKVNTLTGAGFVVSSLPSGASRVIRVGDPVSYAVDLMEAGGEVRVAGRAGVLMADEIGVLVDGGYQKFFLAPGGKKRPAVADDLKALHDFEEDVKERLGLTSLYNEALGTVSTLYQYDRVKDRDRGVPKRAWE